MIPDFLDPTYWFASAAERKLRRISSRERAGLIDQTTAENQRLAVRFEHGLIDAYTHATQAAKIKFSEGTERDIALATIDLEYGKISPKDHEKRIATLRKEPWIGIIDDGFDLAQGINGLFFELDWNEYWIEYLRLNGYGGKDEDAIVESWFQDVCRTQIADEEDNVIPVEMITERLATLKPRS